MTTTEQQDSESGQGHTNAADLNVLIQSDNVTVTSDSSRLFKKQIMNIYYKYSVQVK